MLTVIAQVEDKIENNGKHRAQFLCVCECGNMCVCNVSQLTKNGKEKLSCGCVTRRINNKNGRIHGENKTRLHRIWIGMKNRCNNQNNHAYSYYGGRGIKVCEEWEKSYTAFSE